MTFPNYQWLKSLPNNMNYTFLIFGSYEGTHGVLTYITESGFRKARLIYNIYDGRKLFDSKECIMTETAYNDLQIDFIKSHKNYVKMLLADCSATWVNVHGYVEDDCCFPF